MRSMFLILNFSFRFNINSQAREGEREMKQEREKRQGGIISQGNLCASETPKARCSGSKSILQIIINLIHILKDLNQNNFLLIIFLFFFGFWIFLLFRINN